MNDELIRFLYESKSVLTGDFRTKSGRQSPYFINTGNFHSGSGLGRLAFFYARLINDKFPEASVIFGPAYKGIPLCVSCCLSLQRDFGRDLSYTFNRKEAKDHAEGGSSVGKKLVPEDRVVIVDDVITSGLSVNESFEFLKKNGSPRVLGIVIAVDRREKNQDGLDPINEIQKTFSTRVVSLTDIDEVLVWLRRQGLVDNDLGSRIESYRGRYGLAR